MNEADKSAMIEMALSDHVSFDTIKLEYGLSEKEVVALMRSNLKTGSYRAWRKRVAEFGARRATYK
ncbi:TIGR03643 family protein [Octadecabacter sp.]|nr:TIGR03643 family protein [Octadecabacter sp.]